MNSSDNQKQAIGLRIKEARAALDLTQKELCEQAAMKLPSLRDYELGNRIPGGEAVAALMRVGINANWLLTGEGAMLLEDGQARPAPSAQHVVEERAQPGYMAVPVYDVRAAAGAGAMVEAEEVVDFLHFKQEWIRAELHAQPADLSLIYVDGESMEPMLRPGDVILINRSDQAVTREGIYVLRMDGALLVKRLQRKPGGVIKVSSDNPAYDPFEVKPDQAMSDFAVIGRVVWSGRRM